MTDILAFAFLLILFSGVTLLLERNHRRTADLPRAPFGVDLEGEADLWRVRHDLDVAPAAAPIARPAPTRPHPRPHVHRPRTA